MNKLAEKNYEFGPFRIDTRGRVLLLADKPTHLAPKAFDILLLLVENHGRVLSKDELMQTIWPDVIVEEINLARQISNLRKTLAQSGDAQDYIETVPKRGYIFTAPVQITTAQQQRTPSPTLVAVPPPVFAEIQFAAPREPVATQVINSNPILEKKFAPSDLEPPHEKRALRAPSEKLVSLASETLTPSQSYRLGKPISVMAAVVLLVIATLFWLTFRNTEAPENLAIKSIAVLPFTPLDTQSNDEKLSVGLADALINKLSNIRAITVRPTSAILRFVNAKQDSLTAGRTLGVDALIEGNVQRADDKVRISVQLVRVSDGTPLWAETFDEQFTNVFAVQDSISQSVARTLAVKLNPDETRQLAKRHTQNPTAYRLYLQGRFHALKRTDEALQKAVTLYQQAVELDPNFALAYAGIADCYVALSMPESTLGGRSYQAVAAQAEAAAQKAVALDDTLSEAHAVMGAVIAINPTRRGAEPEFKRALELNPNNSLACHYYTMHLLGNQRLPEALAQIKRAVEIDPLSLPYNTQLAMTLYRMRRDDEAIVQARRTLELEPSFARARWALGLSYEQKGLLKEALQELQQADAMAPNRPVLRASLAHALALAGQRAQAEKILSELSENSAKVYVSPVYIALIYTGLGEYEQAFAQLEKAYQEQSSSLGILPIEHRFDPLRADPRYQALIQRTEFESRTP